MLHSIATKLVPLILFWSANTALATNANSQKLGPKLTPEIVLKAMYPNYNKAKKISYTPYPLKKDDGSFVNPHGNATVETFKIYSESGTQKAIAVIKILEADENGVAFEQNCHVCAPYLSLFSFSKHGKSWQADIKQYDWNNLGSYGIAPEMNVIKIGPEKYGLEILLSSMAFGRDTQSLEILVPMEEKFESAFSSMLDENTEGACEPAKFPCENHYFSYYHFTPDSDKPYYTLQLESFGVREDSGPSTSTLKPTHDLIDYEFTGKTYIVKKQENLLPEDLRKDITKEKLKRAILSAETDLRRLSYQDLVKKIEAGYEQKIAKAPKKSKKKLASERDHWQEKILNDCQKLKTESYENQKNYFDCLTRESEAKLKTLH